MRQPREGEVLWARVSGGRASHAITRESFPRAVCGVDPGQPDRWKVRDYYSWSVIWRRKHKRCRQLTAHMPRRLNFWPPDYDETVHSPGYPVI